MAHLRTLGLLLLPLLISTPAWAGPEGLGHWQGAGTSYAPDGTELGDFTVDLERSAIDDHTVEVRGQVTLASGQVVSFNERQIMNSHGGYLTESHRGKGRGRCFAEDFCQEYQELGDDKARATTIVIDGPGKIRVLITELDHGRAMRFIRQALTRKQ